MKQLKYAALFALGLALAACGGSAQAATNDLIATSADGRLYTFMDAQWIYQTPTVGYTICYNGNANGCISGQAIADSAGTQFTRLASAPGFSSNWLIAKDYSNRTVYVNVGNALSAVCTGGYLTVNSVTYVDTGCTAFLAMKAGAS